MDRRIQQGMLPGSIAWFMVKKPVRVLSVIAIIMVAIFLVICFWIVIDEDWADYVTGTQALLITVFLLACITVAIIASIRASHDNATYIKENGYIFRVVPARGPGARYGGMMGGLMGAAIGAAIDAASGGNVAIGAGVLGMAHTRIAMVCQISRILQIEDKGDAYLVTATLIPYMRGGKAVKPMNQKMRIDKRILAVNGLMAEFGAIHSRSF